jgi:hypothetical protein
VKVDGLSVFPFTEAVVGTVSLAATVPEVAAVVAVVAVAVMFFALPSLAVGATTFFSSLGWVTGWARASVGEAGGLATCSGSCGFDSASDSDSELDAPLKVKVWGSTRSATFLRVGC